MLGKLNDEQRGRKPKRKGFPWFVHQFTQHFGMKWVVTRLS